MIERSAQVQRLARLLRDYPIVGLLGARQIGKPPLARQLAAAWRARTAYFDLEDPAVRLRLAEPMLELRGLRGLVVVDEVQRAPGIFEALRVLADRPSRPARFPGLGSASPDLLRQSSETLAGRIHYHSLGGLGLDEVGANRMRRLWIRGGFPRSFTARSDQVSAQWRRDFARTFLERDIPQLGVTIPAPTLERFWAMLAHYHGQVWNGAEFARSFGVGEMTVRRYLDILVGTFLVRVLAPWRENLAKRQVKAPKVFFSDTGLLHSLLQIDTWEELQRHPRLGASWEGFALGQVVARLGARPDQCHFWSTHAGAELDLLVVHRGRRYGFEFKYAEAPPLTKSMRIAMQDLKLERLDVIHAGEHSFALGGGFRAVALRRLLEDLKPLT